MLAEPLHREGARRRDDDAVADTLQHAPEQQLPESNSLGVNLYAAIMKSFRRHLDVGQA